MDSYAPTGEETESWDASEGSKGSVMAYVSGTKLTLAGNGNKKIYAHMYFSNAFSGFNALIEIKGIERLDTSAVTDMSSLFAECRSLTSLDLSSWDTSSVTNMSYLFQDCYSLTTLNLSGWDTSTTNNMSYLFYCCSALTEIYGIEQFSTSAVTNMSNLFMECKSLTSLDLSSWDTSATTDMEWMLPTVGYYSSSHGFIYCSTLDKITLGKDFHFLTEDAPMGTDDENKTRWRQEGTGFVYTTEELYDLDRSENTTYINGSLVLKSGADWYKGNTAKSVITEIELVGSYTPTGAEAESWDASAAGDGSVMAYISGTKLTLASVGCERIYANAYSGDTFRGFTSMVSIQGLKILNTSAVVYMWSLFDGCKSLTSLDLSSWDTSTVTSMSSLFRNCSALTEIRGIERLDTSTVTSMYELFSDCSSLTSLDLSSWDTSAVTNMCDLFYRCFSLTSLDLSSWNTSATTNMNRAFCVCPKLKHITLGSKFVFVLGNDPMLGSEDAENPEFSDLWQDGNTGILYSASELYKLTRTKTTTYYRKPASILGSAWSNGSTSDLSAITEIEFKDSYTPTGTETESWDASASNNGTVTAYISGTKLTLAGNGRGKIYCPNLTRFGFSGYTSLVSMRGLEILDTSAVTDMSYFFYGCSALTEIKGIEQLNTSAVTDMSCLFLGCKSLTSLNLSGWDTSATTDMSSMFSRCSALTEIKGIEQLNTSAVTNMGYLFDGCSALENLDLSSWDTSVTTNMAGLFIDCSSLTSLDLSGWDTSATTNMSSLFQNCSALTEIRGIEKLNTSSVTNMSQLFYRCSSLTSLDLNSWDTSAATNMFKLFYMCSSLTSLDLSSWDTSAATDMGCLFQNCSALTEVRGIEKLNTSSVTNMSGLFEWCESLTTIDLSGWDTSAATYMVAMFSNCSVLTEIKGIERLNTSEVTNMTSLFAYCSSLTSLDLSGWDTSAVRYMGGTNGDYNGMFLGSRNLRTIYVSEKWSTASVEASGGMFDGCTNLQGAIAYDSTKIDATYANYETGYLTYKAAPGTVQSVMAAAAPDGAEQVITPAGEEPENGSSAGADTEIEPTLEETQEDAASADGKDEQTAEPPDEGGSAAGIILTLALPAVWKGVLYGKTK